MSQIKVNSIVPKDGLPAGASGGGIIQVVQVKHSAVVSTTGTTYVDTGLSATITPSSNSSKILIFVSIGFFIKRDTDQARGGFRLLRGSTPIEQGPNDGSSPENEPDGLGSSTNLGGVKQFAGRYNLHVLDSPATTSATTYKTQFANNQTGSSPTISVNTGDNNAGEKGSSYMTLMEVTA